MTRRALLAVLALVAGFAITAPLPRATAAAAAVSATTNAAHLPDSTTRGTTSVHPVQQAGHLGQPLDGVQPPVHTTPAPPVRADVVAPVHRRSERSDRTPLGDRAPPPTPGS
ncbi:hypothetical protein [Saccharothrix syringae]|uniref:Uncharacterized protein n=1 Tax=Saccharothrix syringae TaxID=103733 RepID=A0A5Q0GSU4_SACSY|nr:hypothetical protein [Saccharothrix syringae]QFZ17127.1 hypothetical protein EKG83_06300 [Saccharothrix syringae]